MDLPIEFAVGFLSTETVLSSAVMVLLRSWKDFAAGVSLCFCQEVGPVLRKPLRG